MRADLLTGRHGRPRRGVATRAGRVNARRRLPDGVTELKSATNARDASMGRGAVRGAAGRAGSPRAGVAVAASRAPSAPPTAAATPPFNRFVPPAFAGGWPSPSATPDYGATSAPTRPR